MLGISSSLYFPRFRYLNRVYFNKRDRSASNLKLTDGIALYSLDWTPKDQACEEYHQKWLQEHWNKCKIPFMPSLPEKYDTWIKSLTFAISHSYMNEITRNTRRGFEEWNIQRSFDTNIREYCLKPAIWHIYIAFYLISDCVYDPESNYYSRNYNENILIPHCLAYKFWAHQTGRGCIAEHADFDALKFQLRFLGNENNRLYDSENRLKKLNIISNFISAIDLLNAQWDNAYSIKTDGVKESSIEPN